MKQIYIVGDSISLQYGPYLQQYLAGIASYARKEGEEEALLNLDNPQGANGGDSSMVLAFLQGKAANGDLIADELLVNCGLHDIKTDPATGARQIPEEAYRSNLEAIVQLAATLPARLIWVRTTPCDEAVHNHAGMAFHRFAADCHTYNGIADEIMTAAGVPVIDLHTFTANLGSGLYCDHVHFAEPVRAQQAAYIAGWLNGLWRQEQALSQK